MYGHATARLTGAAVSPRLSEVVRSARPGYENLANTGLSGVRDDMLLTTTAHNLRLLARLLYRAPPLMAGACLLNWYQYTNVIRHQMSILDPALLPLRWLASSTLDDAKIASLR